jgi:hypothetical protein
MIRFPKTHSIRDGTMFVQQLDTKAEVSSTLGDLWGFRAGREEAFHGLLCVEKAEVKLLVVIGCLENTPVGAMIL